MFLYRLRIFLTIALALGAVVVIFFSISLRTYNEGLVNYNRQLTVAVGTAIGNALFDVTRTAEVPLNRYRLLRLGDHEDLQAVADKYGTTLDLLRLVNQIDASVTEGNGELIIVPVNVDKLDPPRVFQVYVAREGDTLLSIAQHYDVSASILEYDNPVLADRGVAPGDTVFVGTEIIF